MADKAKRGTKRTCGGCGAKFYDLNREPAICPMCETVFEIKKPEPKPKKEPVKEEAPKEEAETEEADVLLEGEDDLIDIDDSDDDAIPSTDDDDTFLEVEDETEGAMESIIPVSSGVSKDDEG